MAPRTSYGDKGADGVEKVRKRHIVLVVSDFILMNIINLM